MPADPQISLREIYRVPVLTTKRNGKVKQIGRVDDVLFDLAEPRAVGFSLKRPWPAALFGRRFSHRYLARSVLVPAYDAEGAQIFTLDAQARPPRGLDWERTVIFYGLPVYTTDLQKLGKVSDALIRWEDGTLAGLEVSAGVASDATLGKRTLPASYVTGFVEAQQEEVPHVLVVDERAKTCGYAGGLASLAGKASARANAAAEKAAVATGVLAGKAIAGTQQAAKAALDSETAQAAKKRARDMWQGFSEGYQEGRHSD